MLRKLARASVLSRSLVLAAGEDPHADVKCLITGMISMLQAEASCLQSSSNVALSCLFLW